MSKHTDYEDANISLLFENILAEVNMLKVLVWKLWEEAHGGINNNDWDDMKKEVINSMRRDK